MNVGSGVNVDPYYFGYNLESWGQDINLSYSDTAGLAYTDALHTGVLRYPGGTGSNIWDPRVGRFMFPLPSWVTEPTAYHKYVPPPPPPPPPPYTYTHTSI
jgi:hypothetical protein